MKSEQISNKDSPVFEREHDAVPNELLMGNIPIGAMDIILEQSHIWNMHIYFLILCQILTGLRSGEALNLSQEISPYGSSFKFTVVSGNITDIAIDLRYKHQMRADGKAVGGIKQPRIHHVYPDYVPVFLDGYSEHLTYLCAQKYDSAYMPLFPDRNGNAMTCESYRYAFRKLVKERVLPLAEKAADTDVKAFAAQLKTDTLTPNALREYYAADLARKGLDIGIIQTYCGDKVPVITAEEFSSQSS